MKLSFSFNLVLLITLFAYSLQQNENDTNGSLELKLEALNGYKLALNAFNTLIFGGDPDSEDTYKDPFIDTSKSAFTILDTANDQVTLDDLIRLFVQTILIIIGKSRTDLFPVDFNEKNAVFGEVIKQLNEMLEKLLNGGSAKVTLKEIKPFIRNLRNDEFWASLSRLNSVVMDQIRLEESTNSNKDKTEL